MPRTEKVQLIAGTFDPADAKDILVALINSKINFHHLKNFSSEERFGEPCTSSKERIEQLKEARQMVIDILQAAADNDDKVIIDSVIKIKPRRMNIVLPDRDKKVQEMEEISL
jgi:hypothetical protein